MSPKLEITLNKKEYFIDYSKADPEVQETTMGPGIFKVILIDEPIGEVGRNTKWFVFEGTTIGGTVEYVKSIATITTLF